MGSGEVEEEGVLTDKALALALYNVVDAFSSMILVRLNQSLHASAKCPWHYGTTGLTLTMSFVFG